MPDLSGAARGSSVVKPLHDMKNTKDMWVWARDAPDTPDRPNRKFRGWDYRILTNGVGVTYSLRLA